MKYYLWFFWKENLKTDIWDGGFYDIPIWWYILAVTPISIPSTVGLSLHHNKIWNFFSLKFSLLNIHQPNFQVSSWSLQWLTPTHLVQIGWNDIQIGNMTIGMGRGSINHLIIIPSYHLLKNLSLIMWTQKNWLIQFQTGIVGGWYGG